MTVEVKRPLLIPILAELMSWALLGSIFIWRYAETPAGSVDAGLEHGRLYGIGVLGLLLLRLLVVAIPSKPLRRSGQAILSFSFITFWAGFYALVLVGLHYWGEVITAEILRVYFGQSETLLATIGVSSKLLLLAVGIVFVAGNIGFFLIHRNHWIEELVCRLGWRRLFIPALGLFAIVFVEIFSFKSQLHLPSKEPLAMVFQGGGDFSDQVLESSGSKTDAIRKTAHEARQNYQPTNQALKANVVLIVVDALRDDHLSLNGYQRSTTPHLQKWITRTGGVTLGQTRASCASSVCGITSIISSKFAHEQTNDAMTLHEVLALHGWQSHLALSGDHTNFYGLRQRYGKVDTYIDGLHVPPDKLNDDRFLLDAVKALVPRMREPSLLHLHLQSAHILGRRFMPLDLFGASDNYSNPMFKMNSEYRQHAVNYYDEGVFQSDYVIHQALMELQRGGFLNRALVLITGDHGEHLGEHERFGHANGIMEPVLRVPWIMLPFGLDLPSLHTKRRLHQVDMAPTILDVLKIPIPSDWSGVSLLSNAGDPEFSYFQQGAEVGLVDHRNPRVEYKYITQPPPGVEKVFNLTNDLGESTEESVSSELIYEWRELMLPKLLRVIKAKR